MPDGEQANVRVLGRVKELLRAVVRLHDGHVHVALAGAEEDVAEENVVQGEVASLRVLEVYAVGATEGTMREGKGQGRTDA